jgi:hypothetical protein
MSGYLGVAVAASLLLASGLVIIKSRAEALPPAQGARILQAVLVWCRDPIWMAGLGVECVGYALSVIALSGAPVSLVAVMMQGGIALFVLFAILGLGERASTAEWAGIGGVIFAMVLVGLSLGAGEAGSPAGAGEIGLLSVFLVGVAAASGTAPRLRNNGAAAAIVSGLAFGLGNLYTKALTQNFLGAPGVAIFTRIVSDPYTYLIVAVNITGLIVLQNGFHRARGIIVMPLSSALSNLVPIFGGILAFGERLPADHTAAAMRLGAFALTIAAGTVLSTTREAETE